MDNQNNKKELIELIQKNKGIIFKICNSYCHNKDAREDLAQEIIYQLWRSGNTFNADQKFSTWMYRVSLNVAISFYRKSKSANTFVQFKENLKDIEDNDYENADYENEHEKTMKLLQKCINELKELDRALMILFLEAKSYKEIAEILGITETNVATKISRIKDKLKQKILNLNN